MNHNTDPARHPVVTREGISCRACGGVGEHYLDSFDPQDVRALECSTCKGTGWEHHDPLLTLHFARKPLARFFAPRNYRWARERAMRPARLGGVK